MCFNSRTLVMNKSNDEVNVTSSFNIEVWKNGRWIKFNRKTKFMSDKTLKKCVAHEKYTEKE